MLSLSDLHSASFKGISFLVTDMSTTFGSKTVDHDYPNSNVRYVENLGTNPRVFTITGVVAGDDYLSRRDQLLQALEDGTIGILVHPFYGIVTVVAKNGTIEETISDLGRAVIVMTFATSVPPIIPGLGATIESLMLAASDLMDGSTQASFSALFHLSLSFPNNYAHSYNKLSTFKSTFDQYKTYFNTSQDFSDLNAEQSKFIANLNVNLRNPTALATSISDLFAIANNASDDPLVTGNAFVQLFSFGNSDIAISQTTTQGQERSINNQIANYVFNAYALMYAYLNYSQATFSDDVQIQTIAKIIETQYLKIINGVVVSSSPINVVDILGSDTLDNLEKMRNLARQSFDSDTLNVAKITPICVKEMPVTVLSYLFYENTDQDSEIIALNNIKDVSFINGKLNVAVNQ